MIARDPVTCDCGARISFREDEGVPQAVRHYHNSEAGAVGTYDDATGVFRAYGADHLPPHIDPNAPPLYLEITEESKQAAKAELEALGHEWLVGKYPYMPEALAVGEKCGRCGCYPEPVSERAPIVLADGARVEWKMHPRGKFEAVRYSAGQSTGVYGSFDESTRGFRAYDAEHLPSELEMGSP